MSTIQQPHRIVVAGSVSSTARTLAALIKHNAPIAGVLGLAPETSKGVSDYVDLEPLAKSAGLPYHAFTKINDVATVAQLQAWEPSLLFAVGLSQLLGDPLLSTPSLGCIGYHPTRLPEGRGRAPLAWLTLGAVKGASSFFHMDAGADSGPLLAQAPFDVTDNTTADEVREALLTAIDVALDAWLPSLLQGEWNPLAQDDARATFCGRRTRLDGWISWQHPADEVHALIRAASSPHPGAFSYYQDTMITVWHSRRHEGPTWVGVPGRILQRDSQLGWLIMCADKPLWISGLTMQLNFDGPLIPVEETLRVGVRLGYYTEHEIHHIRRQMNAQQAEIKKLQEQLQALIN